MAAKQDALRALKHPPQPRHQKHHLRLSYHPQLPSQQYHHRLMFTRGAMVSIKHTYPRQSTVVGNVAEALRPMNPQSRWHHHPSTPRLGNPQHALSRQYHMRMVTGNVAEPLLPMNPQLRWHHHPSTPRLGNPHTQENPSRWNSVITLEASQHLQPLREIVEETADITHRKAVTNPLISETGS